jgi:transcriptional regulator with XRE-family HTH domain
LSIGKKLLLLRAQSNKTQRELARSAGLAVAYLSRLEHDHIIPSVRTLSKIAAALKVPLTAFFNGAPTHEAADRCPISLSGRCILDEQHVALSKQPSAEGYSSLQLEVLKLCNLLLHRGDQQASLTLLITMKSLLAHIEARKARVSSAPASPFNGGNKRRNRAFNPAR